MNNECKTIIRKNKIANLNVKGCMTQGNLMPTVSFVEVRAQINLSASVTEKEIHYFENSGMYRIREGKNQIPHKISKSRPVTVR